MAAYDRAADDHVALYDSIDAATLFAPVAGHLPPVPARLADIGSGTGRDAAWFAGLGYDVLAVEPAAGLRQHGRIRQRHPQIKWLDDRLPELVRLRATGSRFDALILNGVWHHLDAGQRHRALDAMAKLLGEGGAVLIRVRAGPTAPDRPGYDLPLADTLTHAIAAGFAIAACQADESYFAAKRAAGVTWTWLVLRR